MRKRDVWLAGEVLSAPASASTRCARTAIPYRATAPALARIRASRRDPRKLSLRTMLRRLDVIRVDARIRMAKQAC